MTVRDSWYRIAEDLQGLWKQTLQTSVVSCTELVGDSSQLERITVQNDHPLRILGIQNDFCLIQAEINRKHAETTTRSRRTEKVFHVLLSRSEETQDMMKLEQAESIMVLLFGE
jgi:hypothetical protein